jgi:hypothetical protein
MRLDDFPEVRRVLDPLQPHQFATLEGFAFTAAALTDCLRRRYPERRYQVITHGWGNFSVLRHS